MRLLYMIFATIEFLLGIASFIKGDPSAAGYFGMCIGFVALSEIESLKRKIK